MSLENFTVDHIGIAVPDLDRAIEEYKTNFGFEASDREVIETQKTEIVFLDCGNTKLELLAPTTEDSPIQKFIEKRGAGIHHICYRIDDIRAELSRLEGLGHILIDKEPRPGAHNTEIAFLHPKSMGGVLVELCQHTT